MKNGLQNYKTLTHLNTGRVSLIFWTKKETKNQSLSVDKALKPSQILLKLQYYLIISL